MEEGGATSHNIRSVIALPLRGRKGTHGAIEIFNPRTEQMTDYTIAFLHILADHAAIAIENAHDVARIQQLTITDDTTGLYNVRHLYDVLGRELSRCSRLKLPLSLAFIDLSLLGGLLELIMSVSDIAGEGRGTGPCTASSIDLSACIAFAQTKEMSKQMPAGDACRLLTLSRM